MTASVPSDKLEEIITLVDEWQGKTHSKKVELQSLIGKLQICKITMKIYSIGWVFQFGIFIDHFYEFPEKLD